MNFRSLFIVSTLISALSMGTSCSKENLKDSDENVITLTVPAMTGFDDDTPTRTIFDVEGTKPSVGWKEGDKIYIGTAKDETVDINSSLKDLTDARKFSVFNCTSVADNGSATFTGTSIPEGADIAVYTMHPENVIKRYESSQIVFDAPCTTVAPNANGNVEHLGENDLLVASFDYDTKSFEFGTGTYSKTAFQRVFGLGHFILTLPEGASGPLGDFKCLSTGINGFSSQSRVQLYKLDSTGLPNITVSYTDFVVDCSQLTIENNKVEFYSLLGINGSGADKNVQFSIEVGGVTYTKTITANPKVDKISAFTIPLTFEGQQ